MNRKIRIFVSLLRRGREFGYGLMVSYILTASVGRFLPKGLMGRIAVNWRMFTDAQLETEGSTYMYLRNIVNHG